MCHAFLQSWVMKSPFPSVFCGSIGWVLVCSASMRFGGRGVGLGLFNVGPTSQYCWFWFWFWLVVVDDVFSS